MVEINNFLSLSDSQNSNVSHFKIPQQFNSIHVFLGKPQVHFHLKLSTINFINTNLRSEIRNDDELFENILRQDVRESRLFDIVGRHVNMISTQVKVGSGNGADTPLCLGRESGSLVITGGGHDNLIPVNVCGFGGRGGEL